MNIPEFNFINTAVQKLGYFFFKYSKKFSVLIYFKM